ncbi:MAG: hemolysin family protein [Tepidiformaceae bacterium]
MSPALIIVIVAVLIAVNALYVAAEFAAVSVRRSKVVEEAQNGSKLAAALLPVLEDRVRLDRYIAACQIGITISSLVLGAFGQATIPAHIEPLFESLGGLDAAAQSVSAVFVLLFLTVTQVIVGELVPKSLALQYPTRVALLTAIPMRWSLVALRGVIAVLNGSGLAILRLMGSGGASHSHVHSPEEIELLIVQSADGGLLEPGERRRLGRALQLGERSASSLMVPRPYVVAINADDPIDTILSRVAAAPYTRLPVYRQSPDNVIGMLNTKDLILRVVEGPVASIDGLVRPVLTVPETLTADRVLAVLRQRGSQQAVVIDEFGGVAGLITLEDILAEVFGDFGDEFKHGHPGPEHLPDGRIRLPGLTSLGDAVPYLGVRWTGHVDTVGGRVTQELERLPEPGETLVIDGVEVEVETVERHAVTSILVRPLREAEEGLDG